MTPTDVAATPPTPTYRPADPPAAPSDARLLALGLGLGALAWSAIAIVLHGASLAVAITGIAAIGALVLGSPALVQLLPHRHAHSATVLPLVALAALATLLALISFFHVLDYLRIPADLVSFSESPFVTDILKYRADIPLYTDPRDNNSYPYTPGAPILTYLIASAVGHGDSIAVLRYVQYAYVMMAAVVAALTCDLLVRLVTGTRAYAHRPVWIVVWALLLTLIVKDPQFNLYTYSLHNDGLALLVSVVAFWLLARQAVAPSRWIVAAMVVLPTIGFLVKQNQLLWAVIFFVYLLATRTLGWRQLALFVLASTGTLLVALALCYAWWGAEFRYWIFDALGAKQISLWRSGRNLMAAGGYAAMGLLAGWLMALGRGDRRVRVLWLCWALVFGIQVYTSGIGFQPNHMGPGIVLAVCWFLATITVLWPDVIARPVHPRFRVDGWAMAILVMLGIVQLGVVREPRGSVPADLSRYISAIDAEFAAADRNRILLDTGSWPYVPDLIIMKDRSAPVSLHIGINQREINHAALAATIERINRKTYDRILARQLDTDQSWYDYHDRGSGVKRAILDNYHVVRRIPAVTGVQRWPTPHLLSEVLVLEPNP